MSEPGGRLPAPGSLAQVQAFINSFDLEADEDELTDPGALTVWLRARGLLDDVAQADGKDLDRMRALREALRGLIAVHNGLPADVDAAINMVNESAARAKLTPRLGAAGSSQLVPEAGGVDAALGTIIATVHEAVHDGSWHVSRRANAATAAGHSSTPPATTPDDGAPWQCAGVGRRANGPTAEPDRSSESGPWR